MNYYIILTWTHSGLLSGVEQRRGVRKPTRHALRLAGTHSYSIETFGDESVAQARYQSYIAHMKKEQE